MTYKDICRTIEEGCKKPVVVDSDVCCKTKHCCRIEPEDIGEPRMITMILPHMPPGDRWDKEKEKYDNPVRKVGMISCWSNRFGHETSISENLSVVKQVNCFIARDIMYR